MVWPQPVISNRLTVSISLTLLHHLSSAHSALLAEKAGDLGVGSCSDLHISAAVENIQVCKPRPVIVVLPWPNNTNVQQMTPTHVEVNKCAGSCHRTGQSCLPGRQGEREVPVLLGECGISTGRCDKLCATLTIMEDLDCVCGCDTNSLNCRPELHRVNSDLCRCECENVGAKQLCLDTGRLWSEEICQCGELGQSPIQSDCRNTTSSSSSTEQPPTTWHFILIFLLSLAIVIMTLLLVILTRKMVIMRKKIRLQESMRKIQNIDCFYEFMARKRPVSDNKYENVYAVSQCQSSELSHSEDQTLPSQDTGGGGGCTGLTSNPSKHPYKPRARLNTQPIDEALLLLKLSTDRL